MIGRTLAHYRILSQLGAGGMGVVYRAEDTRLERQVALKILPEEMAGDPDRLERFQREAKAVAALNHPNIVTVFSVEQAEGVHFLTMELVEGRPLDELIGRTGMPLDRLLEIARPLADAVSAAHGSGIVHRDLKPANVMVTREGRVKVLDFGLAKMAAVAGGADAAEEQTELRTQPGRVLGTAPYMSPEQVKGGVVDERSDIFSLGIILYEMATGSRPFRGETPADLVSSTLRDAPAPVSELRDDLPRQLGRIVSRCLAKDVERRYQTAKDVRNDLEGLAREASGEVFAGEPARPRRRRPLLWVAAAVLAGLLATVAYLALRAPSATSGSYAIAVLPLDNLIGEAGKEHLPTGIASGLITALSEVSQLRVVGRAEAWDAAARSSSPTTLARRLGINALIEGEVQSQGDRLVVGLRIVDGATGRVVRSESFNARQEEIFSLQRRIATKLISLFEISLSGRERARLARDPTRSFQAYDSFLRAEEHLDREGNPQGLVEAAELFRQAIRIDPEFALAHAGLSEALWLAHLFHHDEGALEEAESAARSALELDPDLPAGQVALARIFRGTGRLEASISGIEQALENHPKPAEAQRELAYAYERAGDLEQAEACLQAATALAGDDWVNWNWLGTFLARSGKYAKARAAFEEASDKAPAGTHLPRENLATLDLSTGDFQAAVEAFEGLPRNLVEARPRLASNIGTAYFFSDRSDGLQRALEHYRLAVDLRPAHATYRGNLGDAYFGLGRGEEALEQYRQALNLKAADLERDPGNPRFRLEWAQYAAKARQCQEALPEADQLAEELPESGSSAHQLAFVYALCDRPAPALEALRRAVDLGQSTTTIRREREFDSLRGMAEFEALLADGG